MSDVTDPIEDGAAAPRLVQGLLPEPDCRHAAHTVAQAQPVLPRRRLITDEDLAAFCRPARRLGWQKTIAGQPLGAADATDRQRALWALALLTAAWLRGRR